MEPAKLKQTQVKAYREKLVHKQDHICPLCELTLTVEDAVLDHDHETGRIRYALHRSCNSAEGRILHWASVRSKGDDPALWIENLSKYWKVDYSANPLHHTHGKPKKKRKRRPRMKGKVNVR